MIEFSPQDFQRAAQRFREAVLDNQPELITRVEDYTLSADKLKDGCYQTINPNCPVMIVIIHPSRPLAMSMFVHRHYSSFHLQSTQVGGNACWDSLPTNLRRSFWEAFVRFRLAYEPAPLKLVK